MAIIANPIYDSVFKYLMEDQRVAKVILSDLLQREVLEVTMRSNEYTQKLKDDISVLRIDFGAKIKDENGEVENVNIELQKAWLPSEIMRFRTYLSQQYQSQDNAVIISEKPLRQKPLHIVNIYLLGHDVANLSLPVTYVYPKMFSQFGEEITEPIRNIDFVNELMHEMIIVQIPKLKKTSVVTKLDNLLSLFDQNQRMSNEHQLLIEESSVLDEHACVFNRLLRANSNEKICRSMQVEDEYQSVLDQYEYDLAEIKEEVKKHKEVVQKQKEAIETQTKTIKEQEELVKLKEKALTEKDDTIAKQKEQLEKTKDLLRSLGLTEDQIKERL